MRRRSTAWSMWQAAGRCVLVRSPGYESIAPTNTTCTAPWWDFEVLLAPQDREAAVASLIAFVQHVHHRFHQSRKLIRADSECRREINDGAERAHEHPLLHETRAQAFEIVDAVELHHADCALHPHVLGAGKAAAGGQAVLERRCNIRNLPQARF